MPVLTIRTEDEEASKLLLSLARRLGMDVESAPLPEPAPPRMPPRSWAGLISKEEGQMLLDEVDYMRKHEWDRQF